MFYKKIHTIALCVLTTLSLQAQASLGVVAHQSDKSQPGYTFFSPFSGTKAWLIDNCGHLINSWNRGTRPGLSAYFLENGLILRTYKPSPAGPFTSASNAGGLELVDWDNNTVWQYELNTPTQITHHDAVAMPNGHFLVLSWELVYANELIALGRNPTQIAPEGYMWSERILELEPTGAFGANIVWEWRIKDHYVQDFDLVKANYGVVSEHPELFNINLPELNSSNSNSSRDWNHFNSIDYHPGQDQILISVRNSDEIWIIDHSTTTAEAATHSGGLYGKGGDILYRWGNASAYQRGPVSAQKLFGQHGVNWIREGLNDAGKIMIFNNGNGRPGPDFSTGEIITPPQTPNGGYIMPTTEPFGPDIADWIYGNLPGENFYSDYLSNAQRLPNGNSLLNAGTPGRIIEVDPQRQRVWEYIIPLNGDFPLTQGQNASNNSTFRAYKYPPDYPGFVGKNLTPGPTIENGANPLNCMLSDLHPSPGQQPGTQIRFLSKNQRLEILNPEHLDLRITVYNSLGMSCFSGQTNDSERRFDVPGLGSGVYFVVLRSGRGLEATLAFVVL